MEVAEYVVVEKDSAFVSDEVMESETLAATKVIQQKITINAKSRLDFRTPLIIWIYIQSPILCSTLYFQSILGDRVIEGREQWARKSGRKHEDIHHAS